MLFLRVFACSFGFVLLGLVAFVYEDREKLIQNRLESWWVELDERRIRTQASEALLRAKFSTFGIRLLDELFGRRLLSFRLFTVSLVASATFSPLLYAVSVSLLNDYVFIQNAPEGLHQLLAQSILITAWNALCFAALIWWRSYLFKRTFKSILLSAAITLNSFIFGIWGLLMSPSELLDNVLAPLTLIFMLLPFLIPLTLSIAVNVLVIWLVRVFFRRSSQIASRSLYLLCTVILSALLAILCVLVPFLVPGLGVLTLFFVSYNAAAVLFLVAISFALGVLFVNHSLWPITQRPLYALQRANVFAHKKELVAVACGAIYLSLPLHKPWTRPLIDLLRSLFGG